MVKLTNGAAGELYQLLALISSAYQDNYMPFITFSERAADIYVLNIHATDEAIIDMLAEEGFDYVPDLDGIEVEFVSQMV